ncbi:MAG: GDP-mannose 4,6-dehydratase [bacterium]
MKAFITGIAGFAGSHLADHLLSLGHEVSGLILKGAGADNLKRIADRVTLREGDILEPGGLRAILEETAPDWVFHLAALSSVPASWQRPAHTFEVNAMGGIRILETCRNLEKPPLLAVVSSSEVHGRIPPSGVLTEDAPFAPENPYAVSKLALDLMADQYARAPERPLRVIRLRPRNHAGPRQETGFVVSDFAKQVAEIEAGRREPVIRVGNLEARRDFTDVRDIVRAYVLAAERGESGEAYLICTGKTRRIGDILGILLSLSRERIGVEADPAKRRPSDLDHPATPPAKLEKATGWRPEIPLEKTLADTLDDWRARVRAGGAERASG